MGAPGMSMATRAELERKRTTLRAVKDAVEGGLDVLDEISMTTS